MFRNAQLCTYILKNIQEEDPQVTPFSLVFIVQGCVLKMNYMYLKMSPGECFGIITPPPNFE